MYRIIKKISGAIILATFTTISSCNLEDFNLDKLSDQQDMVATIFAPLGYGTFEIEDLVTVSLPDNFPVPSDSLALKPILMNKEGTTFRNEAIDSVYLVSVINNDTPVEMDYDLNFISASTGLPIGKTFHSGTIPAGAKNFRVQFDLGPVDQDNLMDSSDIKISANLASPDNAVQLLYKAVKNTFFTIKISFYAPANLWEISKSNL